VHASKDPIFGYKKNPTNYMLRGPKANSTMTRIFLKAGRLNKSTLTPLSLALRNDEVMTIFPQAGKGGMIRVGRL
jgi:hypothetical protein